jgi:hypothetical protein
MRFMILVKADKHSEAGVLPDQKLLTETGQYNEELAKAGVLLAGEGLHPSAKGARQVLWKPVDGHQRALRRDEGVDRRFLALAGAVEGGGDRMGQALSHAPRHGDRDRDSPGARGGGLRSRAHTRTQGARGAPARAGGHEAILVARFSWHWQRTGTAPVDLPYAWQV